MFELYKTQTRVLYSCLSGTVIKINKHRRVLTTNAANVPQCSTLLSHGDWYPTAPECPSLWNDDEEGSILAPEHRHPADISPLPLITKSSLPV